MKVSQASRVLILMAGVMALVLVGIAAYCASEGPLLGAWTDVQRPIPTPRNLVAYCTVNYRLWVIGGTDSTGAVKDTVEAYYPFTNAWERDTNSGGIHKPLPSPRTNACAAAVGGTIYVIGGRAADGSITGDVLAYDITNKVWTQKASMIVPREGCAAVVYGGKIHVIGGFSDDGQSVYDIYDPAQDRWYTDTCYGFVALAGGTAAVTIDKSANPIEDYLYFIGGADQSGQVASIVLCGRMKLDGCLDFGTFLDYARSGHSSCVVTAVNPAGGSMDYVLVLGGHSDQLGYMQNAQVYLPKPYDRWVNDTWLPSPRGGRFAVGVIGTNVYVAAGSNDAGMTAVTLKAPINGGNYPPAPAPVPDDAVITEWRDMLSDIPTPRIKTASAVVNDRIYVIGGTNSAEDCIYDAVEEYIPGANLWLQRTPIPIPVMKACAAELNGKIYVFGGVYDWVISVDPEGPDYWEVCTGIMQIYDPDTDTWSIANGVTLPRKEAKAVSIGGKIYVIGGYIQTETSSSMTTSIEIYDPQSDTWSPASFSCPWDAINTAVFTRTTESGTPPQLFFAGGQIDQTAYPYCSFITPGSTTWTPIEDLPVGGITGAGGVTIAAGNGRVSPMIFGGENPPVGFYNRCYAYYADEYSWPTAVWKPDTPMPYPVGGNPTVAQICNYVYVIGGESPTYDGINPHVIRGTINDGYIRAVGSISVVKQESDDTFIRLTEPKVITSVVKDPVSGKQIYFYIEENNRSNGIRITGGTQPVVEGNRVYVDGVVGTLGSGERNVNATTVTMDSLSGLPTLRALGIPIRNIGGRIRTPANGYLVRPGLASVGLLVRVWGKITRMPLPDGLGHSYFYIDDGSKILDGTNYAGSPNRGIRIWYPDAVTLPAGVQDGSYVLVEGVSSLEQVMEGTITQIIITSPSDVTPVF